MEGLQVLEALKDIVTIVAATTGGVVAVLGLNAWRKQMRGKTDYDVARRYMRAAYRLRDAMRYVRNPAMWIEEMRKAREEEGLDPDQHEARDTEAAVYNRRWKKVVEATSDLELERLDAEVSWGKPAADACKPLEACQRRLYAGLSMHLKGHGREKTDDIIYNSGDDNTFTLEVDAAIRTLEDYLRPHLR